MPRPRLIKPKKYTQDMLTGANPRERHKCKLPCKGGSRLFGFFKTQNARPGPIHTLDAYDAGEHAAPKPMTLSPHWNTKPTKRFAAN